VCLSELGRALLPHFKKLDQCVERVRRDAAHLNSPPKDEIDRTNREEPAQITAYRRYSRAHHSNGAVLRDWDKVNERGRAEATVDSTQ